MDMKDVGSSCSHPDEDWDYDGESWVCYQCGAREDTPALLPCPFCGCPDIRILPQKDGFSVDCLSCCAKIPVITSFKEQAIASWNLRKPKVTAMAKTKTRQPYNNVCDGCKFIGKHKYAGRDCDIYLCGNGSKVSRTFVARYGNKDSEYYSGVLFETTKLSYIDNFVLAGGLELTKCEKDCLFRSLMREHTEKLTVNKDLPELGFMGSHDWFML